MHTGTWCQALQLVARGGQLDGGAGDLGLHDGAGVDRPVGRAIVGLPQNGLTLPDCVAGDVVLGKTDRPQLLRDGGRFLSPGRPTVVGFEDRPGGSDDPSRVGIDRE